MTPILKIILFSRFFGFGVGYFATLMWAVHDRMIAWSQEHRMIPNFACAVFSTSISFCFSLICNVFELENRWLQRRGSFCTWYDKKIEIFLCWSGWCFVGRQGQCSSVISLYSVVPLLCTQHQLPQLIFGFQFALVQFQDTGATCLFVRLSIFKLLHCFSMNFLRHFLWRCNPWQFSISGYSKRLWGAGTQNHRQPGTSTSLSTFCSRCCSALHDSKCETVRWLRCLDQRQSTARKSSLQWNQKVSELWQTMCQIPRFWSEKCWNASEKVCHVHWWQYSVVPVLSKIQAVTMELWHLTAF